MAPISYSGELACPHSHSGSRMPFEWDSGQKYAAALFLQLRLPSWKEEMSVMQKVKGEPEQLVLLVPDSLAWAMVDSPEQREAGTNAWQCVLRSIKGEELIICARGKKRGFSLPHWVSLCVLLLYCFRNKHSVSIFRANVPTLSSPTQSFYVTNLQVELSR